MITIGPTALRLVVLATAAAFTLALAAPALADPPGDWRRDAVIVSDTVGTSSVRPDDWAIRTGPPTGATNPSLATLTSSGGEGVFDWSDVLVALVVGALGILAVATTRSGRLRRA